MILKMLAIHHVITLSLRCLATLVLEITFKEEAIQLAWSFITDGLKLEKDRLWVTIFEDDDEAASIWLEKVGVSADRLVRLGEKSNFWSMGDTGPCGPCSEIFYDHGDHIDGGPPGSDDEDGDRFVEIWNLVFMQFDRQANGELVNLPKPSVDTGMGLERNCSSDARCKQ